ncbi:thioredoxin [Niastella sp. OAS944]|uniref:thioredoxin n=1 Tax=Niastella sp. OAS944 TaxID=2664089 RepID=UPI00348A7F3F|nr:thioredoxin 1 [Chitinophagaceae bacterium OAS944]
MYMKAASFLLHIAVITAGIFIINGFRTPDIKEIKGGGAIEFTDANFESKALKSNKLTVVDFWAEWCGPCRKIGPVVEQLAKEYNGKVNIGKVNVDKCPNTTIEYGVTSIPTLLFIKNGKVVDKLIGGHPKSTIEKKIKALM